jgi:hypothetical protein
MEQGKDPTWLKGKGRRKREGVAGRGKQGRGMRDTRSPTAHTPA